MIEAIIPMAARTRGYRAPSIPVTPYKPTVEIPSVIDAIMEPT